MDDNIANALHVDMVVDITTTGRKTGEERRIEIWAHYIEGRILMAGAPGSRSWYANMLADPKVTLHLKDDVKADLTMRKHLVKVIIV